MKKLIAKVFGVELHANAQNIHGKKSSGVEDYSSYSNWKAQEGWADAGGSWHSPEY